jgi:peptide/nickel transport system substrate-binding protein
MKLPSKKQWKNFFKVLNIFEKILFFLFLLLFLSSTIFLSINFYFAKTKIVPKEGGKYIEGILGTPRWINPIFSPLNDADRDLVELIYSGILKYGENNLENDLAEDLKILDEGKTYEISLKDNIFWSDGEKITSDDIIFTIKAIQNSETKSPLRPAWLDVEIERVSEKKLRFKLKESSATFIENLTLKPIPKHKWQEIPQKDFSLSILNLKPISSGPYQISKLNFDKEGKIVSILLKENEKYFGKRPYLKEIEFKFFGKKEELIESWKNGQIMGFYLPQEKYFGEIKNFYRFKSPRYFAIFFNQKNSKVLNSLNVRQALNYLVDKRKILEGIPEIVLIDSPLLPEIYGLKEPEKIYGFDPEKGKEILEKEGFKKENDERVKIIKTETGYQFKLDLKFGSKGKEVEELQKCLSKFPEIYQGEISGYFGEKTKEAVIKFQEKYKEEILKPFGLEKGTGEVKEATRKKLNELCFSEKEERIPLQISLATVNEKAFVEISEKLKEELKNQGIELKLEFYDPNTLLEIIKERKYDAILIGEALTKILDPFPFWHSSQTKDPGLNLCLYENKESDKILEEARKTLDEKERKEKLEKFQEILIENSPAIFLFRGDYFYFVSKIKGIKERTILDPSQRFLGIENWYLKEKRAWK